MGGTRAGLDYDQLLISEQVSFAGTLDISLIQGFEPQPGEQFTIATFGSRLGEYANYVGLDLGNGLRIEPIYSDTSLILAVMENPPPRVVGVTVNADQIDPPDLNGAPQPTNWQKQHSDIRSITVTFDEPIIATAGDLTLTNLGINAPVDEDLTFALSDDHLSINGNELTLTFAVQELTNGVYQLDVLATVTDLAGNPLDGDGDGLGGDGFTFTGDGTNLFYKLAADFNGDQGVSIFDFSTFAYWFGSLVPAAPAYADLNDDGGVSIFDFPTFASLFGTNVTFPEALHGGHEFERWAGDERLLSELVQEPVRRQDDEPWQTAEHRLRGDAALMELLDDWHLVRDANQQNDAPASGSDGDEERGRDRLQGAVSDWEQLLASTIV